jgi:phosphoenolpyruvate carboxylase
MLWGFVARIDFFHSILFRLYVDRLFFKSPTNAPLRRSTEAWGRRIFRTLEEKYERACRATLQSTGKRRLLDQSPALQRSIAVRNPYVDPLSFLQVELQARRRQRDGNTEPSDGDMEKLPSNCCTRLNIEVEPSFNSFFKAFSPTGQMRCKLSSHAAASSIVWEVWVL